MNDVKFKSLNELYERIYPALNTKINILKEKKIILNEELLWDYLKNNIWDKANNLDLYTMISDIFDINENDLIKYINRERDRKNGYKLYN